MLLKRGDTGDRKANHTKQNTQELTVAKPSGAAREPLSLCHVRLSMI